MKIVDLRAGVSNYSESGLLILVQSDWASLQADEPRCRRHKKYAHLVLEEEGKKAKVIMQRDRLLSRAS